MRTFRQTLAVLTLVFFCLAARAEDKFVWRAETNRVDADIQSWTLETLLEKVSAAAGWEIYMEPGSAHNVSVKFSNLSVEDALKRLLGKLNYALLPQTNAAPRFYVFQTSMGKATELIGTGKKKVDLSREDWIPDELIVSLDPECKSTIEEVSKSLDGKILGRDEKHRVYRLKFGSVAAAQVALKELNENDCVARTEPNFRIRQQPPVARSPIASQSPFPLNPTAKNDPNNIVVAVLDTAVQLSGSEFDKFVLPQIRVAGESANPDGPMHGTFMAEAVAQNGSSNTKILPVDVYGKSVTATTFEIGMGINAAVEAGATIINLSLGTYGASPYLEMLIRNVAGQNILIFAAAGNDPVAAPVFPASYSGVIGVTAGSDGKLDPYANRYPGNDLMVPGQSLGHYKGNAFVVTGSSSASASAAGAAAGLMGKAGLSVLQVPVVLKKNFPYTPPPQ